MPLRTWLPSLLLLAACGQESSSSEGPTWYADVEPIVQVHCNACHEAGGIAGVVFEEDALEGLAGMMADRVEAGIMPPWLPGEEGPALVGERRLTDEQIQTIRAWAKAGAPLGDPADHLERAPHRTFQPDGPPDVVVTLPTAYEPNKALEDDIRCFVVDLPFDESVWITAMRFVPDQTSGVHHIAGGTAVASEVAKARLIDEQEVDEDGINRPGYACTGGMRVTLSSLVGVDGAASEGHPMPEGTGIYVQAGSSLLLSMHYWTPGIEAPDQSAVEIWTADDPRGLRPISPWAISAPSELPCPTGVSDDPSSPCSRQSAIDRVDAFEPPIVEAYNDLFLRRCHTSLDELYESLEFTDETPEHFYIRTRCEMEVPYDADLQVLHPHMHTRGASARIEVAHAGGATETLIDIPRWDWHWESSYVLQAPAPVRAGDTLSVECVFDNGSLAQPIDARDPRYIVFGEGRYDDMCLGFFSYTRPAPAGTAYGSLCEEARSRYDAACPGRTDLSAYIWPAGSCTGAPEGYAVQFMMSPPDVVADYWCNPEPTTGEGASCAETLNCAAAEPCTLGANCTASCRDDASPRAQYRFDHYLECAVEECAGLFGYDWWYCSAVACSGQLESCMADI